MSEQASIEQTPSLIERMAHVATLREAFEVARQGDSNDAVEDAAVELIEALESELERVGFVVVHTSTADLDLEDTIRENAGQRPRRTNYQPGERVVFREDGHGPEFRGQITTADYEGEDPWPVSYGVALDGGGVLTAKVTELQKVRS